MSKILIYSAAILIGSHAQAKLFTNSYVSFELPDRWNCILEKTEWVCRADAENKKKEAAILLTAKEVGPSDSFASYEQYLKTPRSVAGPGGKPIASQIKHVKTIQISGQPWVDGMHLGSEVPFYYTRYLATIKDQIAVLVTFSAHQRYYTQYANDFFRAIQSLKVIASPNLLSGSAGMGGGLGAGESVGVPTGIPTDMGAAEMPAEPRGASGGKEKALGFALLLVAIGAYFVMKRKKSQKKSPF